MDTVGKLGNTLGNSSATTSYSTTSIEKVAIDKKEIEKAIKENINIKADNVSELVDEMNEMLNPTLTSLRFQMHEETNRYYVELVDIVKNEVIKEIPSKKLLDIYAAIDQFLGLLFDKKA